MTRSLRTVVTGASALIILMVGGALGSVNANPAEQMAYGSAASGRLLTPEDVDAWLDGLLPYAIHSGQIAGAVVLVVKDGHVLTEKGYGYADVVRQVAMDPLTTVIRPGSISKLFTWTAVMQLVERGSLDLDADINGYLDFTIPSFDGKPITLRNIMTHTSGFEEVLKDLASDAPPVPLAEYLRSHLPPRIYPPGKIPAYSNYATALAGYIVERVSRESFDAYIERHILSPLGMEHSSFRQPLPDNLQRAMSRGYKLASLPPGYLEYCGPGPAGSLATTTDDMARFMSAHLQNGRYGAARILSDETAIAMHAVQPKVYPSLNGAALGFYETSRNGHRVIAHNGGTQFFHSDLHLFIDDGVGIFVSLNSAGEDGAVSRIHDALFHGFADRYFAAGPAASVKSLNLSTAVQHSVLMAGAWENSRRSASTFMSVTGLLEPLTITSNADGTITMPVPTRGTTSFREIAPYVWQEIGGVEKIQALTVDGRPAMLGFGMAPPAAFLPIPGFRSPTWLLPATALALTVLLLTGLSWPIAFIARRFYGLRSPHVGTALLAYRALRLSSLATVAVMFAFLGTLLYLSDDFARLSTRTDGWIIGLQISILVVVTGGIAVSGWNAFAAWTHSRSWSARFWSIAVLASSVTILWLTLVLRLLIPNTHY